MKSAEHPVSMDPWNARNGKQMWTKQVSLHLSLYQNLSEHLHFLVHWTFCRLNSTCGTSANLEIGFRDGLKEMLYAEIGKQLIV